MTKAYSIRLDPNTIELLDSMAGTTLSDKIRGILSWVKMYPLYHESIQEHIKSLSHTVESHTP